MTDPPRRRHLPVIHAPAPAGPVPPRPWLGIALCAVATLVLWAPLAAVAQLAGRSLAGWLAPALDPRAPTAWLARASVLDKSLMAACLVGLPSASFVVAGLAAGALMARRSSTTRSHQAGSGVALAALAVWVLASARMGLSYALITLAVACAVGYLSGWAGHWIGSRTLRTNPRGSMSDLDESARER